MPETKTKLKLKIVGTDGDAFALLGRASQVMKKERWPKEKRDEILEEATAGDYNHLLQTLLKHFEVE